MLQLTDLRDAAAPLLAESAALADPGNTTKAAWPIHIYNQLANGVMYPFNGRFIAVPYLPVQHRPFYLRQTHESFGHFKTSASIDSLRARYWWPNMVEDYRQFILTCKDCALVDRKRAGKPSLLPLQDPGIPFHTWHLDFLQDLPESTLDNTQVLVAIDRSTRLTRAQACISRSTDTVINFLDELLHIYGCPSVIIHDRALCFLSSEFKEYCARHNIQSLPSSSYHPQTNGMVERLNQELKRMLVKLCHSDLHLWDRY